MSATANNYEPVLQRLQQEFEQDTTPQQYASALRTVLDDYALLLIESGEDRSYATGPLFDLQRLVKLLHNC